MATLGGIAAWSERAKDVLVQQLRNHFSLALAQASTNCLKEMPQIEKYGLAGQTSEESFVQINTQLPHTQQRIPHIAIMSAANTEKKMNIGRQVVHTFHHPVTGKPMIREIVGGDMTVVIEISSVDTNVRSEISDLVYNFFVLYAEETAFSFLGDTEPDPNTGVPNNYQLILKSQAVLQGETQTPRPHGETFDILYFNRVSVPILFFDYPDREGFDVQVCPNPLLTPEDDEQFKHLGEPLPLSEPFALSFVAQDDFESSGSLLGIDQTKWSISSNASAFIHRVIKPDAIRGVGSASFDSLTDGQEVGALVNQVNFGILSGKVRCRFRMSNGNSVLVIFCMLQGTNPITDNCYHLIIKPSRKPADSFQEFTRMQLVKGPISIGPVVPIGEGARIMVPTETNLSAQLEWKIDPAHKRIRLRGYLAQCESDEFGALRKRLEIFDNTDAYLASNGEGAGFRENPDLSGEAGVVVIDDIQIIAEYGVPQVNAARVLLP